MAYRTVLNVAGLDRGDRDLERAIALCEPVGAHLSVLVLAVAVPPPMGDATMVAEAWVQERQADLTRLEERVGAITKLLAGSALPADVASEYPDL
ncbi:universal stress protein, partial [Rhizobiaceae sp. 2RAB30]